MDVVLSWSGCPSGKTALLLRLDGTGNAGFLVRVSDPAIGTDAHVGYYVGLSNDSIFLGRQGYDWTELASAPLSGPRTGTWYSVSARAVGCDFEISAKRAGSNEVPVALSYTDPDCAETGAIGVRDFEANASFREVRVTPL